MKTQQNQTEPMSRRDMILASGLVVTGLSQSGRVIAQDSADEKELIFRTSDPRNAEPELEDLIKSWITPTKYFYVRSHAPNPTINVYDYRLTVEGLVDRPLSLSLTDLQQMSPHTLTATLTCAGNRRSEFNEGGKVGGVQWEAGPIGNATWKGVSLADVLRKAGVQEAAKHVWFEGLDEIEKGEGTIPFGASVPIGKALAEDEVGTLLAYEMNGKRLTADHGFPLRTVVPGYIGARSVKWLGKIVVSDRTSPNHYLASAYKIVKKTDPLDWSEAGPIYRFPINAAIGSHRKDAQLKSGKVELSGYVLPSGILGARVRRVFVSGNGGDTWQAAELTGEQNDYCWQLWKAHVDVTTATSELIVRATDTSGGFMPARVPWNAKGYLQNSWYRLPVKVD